MLRFDIITILPHFFDSFLEESLIKKARERKLVDIRVHNLRDWTEDKHRVVDDTPYGGGPGMVLKIEPIYRAVRELKAKSDPSGSPEGHPERKSKGKKVKVVFLTPRGKQFRQRAAYEWAELDQLIIIAGRYEGVDERVRKLADETVSVGPYLMLGGEVPAMAIVEAVARLVPDVVGRRDSIEKLDYPQYTRPEVFEIERRRSNVEGRKIQKLRVPKLLVSGDHKKIDAWRQKHSKSIK
jgi:tRNA (guanine37-N1)-methyltransferase